MPFADGDEAIRSQSLLATPEVATPSELAETRDIVVVHVPDQWPAIHQPGHGRDHGRIEDVVHIDDIGIESR
jgi:hypothetical protein